MEDWKIRVAVLWLIEGGAILAYIILRLMETGVLEGGMAREIEGTEIGPELLLLFAIVSLAPLIIAFLSLTLKDKTNRWANIILGIVFAIIPLAVLSKSVAQSSAYAILLNLSGVVASALIVWYAWKSKQKA